VKRARATGDTLHNKARVLIDENRHKSGKQEKRKQSGTQESMKNSKTSCFETHSLRTLASR
jgi:hypothetical protein